MSSLFEIIETSRPYKDLGVEVWNDMLKPSEQVLWTGRPARGPRLTQIVAGMIGFAIAGHAVLALILFNVMPDAGLPSTGVLVVLGFMSVILVSMPILFVCVEAWMRNFLYYAVTDQRAVILDTQGGPPFRLTAYPIEPGMALSMSLGRLRTLWFKQRVTTSIRKTQPVTYVDPKRLQAGAYARVQAKAEITYDSSAPKAFRFLEDAEDVRDLIQQVADGTYQHGSSLGA